MTFSAPNPLLLSAIVLICTKASDPQDLSRNSIASALSRSVMVIRPASLALLLLLASPARAATVLSVGDGDTLWVVSGSRN